MKDFLVVFRPSKTIVKVSEGTTLLQAAEKAEILLPTVCGGRGKCGKCKIKILHPSFDHNINEKMVLTSREINSGIYLACQVKIEQDLEVEALSTDSVEPVKEVSYLEPVNSEIDHHLKKIYLELKPPGLNSPSDDLQQLKRVIDCDELHVPLSLLQNLSTFLRKNNYRVTFVLTDGHVLNLESGDTTKRSFGLAFDLGTTTIAGILIDLQTGENLAVHSMTNPQYVHGADVISRVDYSKNEPGGLSRLQNMVIRGINELIEKLTQETNVSYREIYEVSIACNTIMNHILLGVNPQYIGEAPYVPTFREGQIFNAEELGLTLLSTAPVMVLPNISGYVGGDITGFILAYNLHKNDKITLSIDIGTNGEIVLGSRQELVCCSAAAGPAFEGGHISCGMRATKGAIEKIVFDDEAIFYSVIGDTEPKGICGTGLIDLIAEMLRAGIINKTGRICKPEEIKNDWFRKRIVKKENDIGFIVVPAKETSNKEDLIITQRDIRELQLAKAAFMAGIKILTHELNITVQEIEDVLIAGAFGTYINKYNAQLIGLIPGVINHERVSFVGNAASMGAKKFLLSRKARNEAQHIVNFTRYVELSMREDFQKEFTEAMFF